MERVSQPEDEESHPENLPVWGTVMGGTLTGTRKGPKEKEGESERERERRGRGKGRESGPEGQAAYRDKGGRKRGKVESNRGASTDLSAKRECTGMPRL